MVCYIIQHTWWKKPKVYDFSHSTTGQKLYHIGQTTVSRGNAVVEKSISSAPFFRLFLTNIFPQTSSNLCKKCWFNLFLWNNLMTHDSLHIKTNISKYFKEEQTSLPTSGREIPCCHLQWPLKGSVNVWYFLWLSWYTLMKFFFCSSNSIQGRNFDTTITKKFDGINQKATQLISQLVGCNTSTFMPNPINMFRISVHSVSRQAPLWLSILERCLSVSGPCRSIKYYNLPNCFFSGSECQHLKRFCTNFSNMKQKLDAYALFFKVCHFLKK